MSELHCEIRVTLGRDTDPFHLGHLITQVDLDEIMPPRGPVMTPDDQYQWQRAAERRQRFVDVISSQIAQAITEALFKKAMKA